MYKFRCFLRQLFSTVLTMSCLCLMTLVSAAEGIALPTAGDVIAPEIEHKPFLGQLSANTPTEVRATVTDNVGVREVTIFYRNVGASEFTRKQMQKVPGTDDYLLQLGTIESPGVEYYLQATDLAGNTLLRGAEFQPIVISVAPAMFDIAPGNMSGSTQVTKKTALSITDKPWKKYLYIGLGVLAVGLALNNDDSGNPPDSKTASVIVQAPAP